MFAIKCFIFAPRGGILAMVIPWPFLQRHQEVIFWPCPTILFFPDTTIDWILMKYAEDCHDTRNLQLDMTNYLKMCKAMFKLVPYKVVTGFRKSTKHHCTTIKCCTYCQIELTVLFKCFVKTLSNFKACLLRLLGSCVISKERYIWAMKRLVVAVLVRYY